MIKETTDKAAVVDTEFHWFDAKEYPPPRGGKLQCINKHTGVAVMSVWNDAYGFTHWCPLPTFKKETHERRPHYPLACESQTPPHP